MEPIHKTQSYYSQLKCNTSSFRRHVYQTNHSLPMSCNKKRLVHRNTMTNNTYAFFKKKKIVMSITTMNANRSVIVYIRHVFDSRQVLNIDLTSRQVITMLNGTLSPKLNKKKNTTFYLFTCSISLVTMGRSQELALSEMKLFCPRTQSTTTTSQSTKMNVLRVSVY